MPLEDRRPKEEPDGSTEKAHRPALKETATQQKVHGRFLLWKVTAPKWLCRGVTPMARRTGPFAGTTGVLRVDFTQRRKARQRYGQLRRRGAGGQARSGTRGNGAKCKCPRHRRPADGAGAGGRRARCCTYLCALGYALHPPGPHAQQPRSTHRRALQPAPSAAAHALAPPRLRGSTRWRRTASWLAPL